MAGGTARVLHGAGAPRTSCPTGRQGSGSAQRGAETSGPAPPLNGTHCCHIHAHKLSTACQLLALTASGRHGAPSTRVQRAQAHTARSIGGHVRRRTKCAVCRGGAINVGMVPRRHHTRLRGAHSSICGRSFTLRTLSDAPTTSPGMSATCCRHACTGETKRHAQSLYQPYPTTRQHRLGQHPHRDNKPQFGGGGARHWTRSMYRVAVVVGKFDHAQMRVEGGERIVRHFWVCL